MTLGWTTGFGTKVPQAYMQVIFFVHNPILHCKASNKTSNSTEAKNPQ